MPVLSLHEQEMFWSTTNAYITLKNDTSLQTLLRGYVETQCAWLQNCLSLYHAQLQGVDRGN